MFYVYDGWSYDGKSRLAEVWCWDCANFDLREEHEFSELVPLEEFRKQNPDQEVDVTCVRCGKEGS